MRSQSELAALKVALLARLRGYHDLNEGNMCTHFGFVSLMLCSKLLTALAVATLAAELTPKAGR
jgi:hypothetical protein